MKKAENEEEKDKIFVEKQKEAFFIVFLCDVFDLYNHNSYLQMEIVVSIHEFRPVY